MNTATASKSLDDITAETVAALNSSGRIGFQVSRSRDNGIFLKTPGAAMNAADYLRKAHNIQASASFFRGVGWRLVTV